MKTLMKMPLGFKKRVVEMRRCVFWIKDKVEIKLVKLDRFNEFYNFIN